MGNDRGELSSTAAGVPDLTLAPQPWEYNPSKWSQRIMISCVAAPAFFISCYMGLYQWRLIGRVWDPVWGEQSMMVLDSDVSETMRRWFRMPDAVFGAIAYLGDIVFALAGSTRRWQFRPWLVMVFGLDVIPLGIVSAVLVFMQGAVVGSWCFLCIVTAVISLILVALAYDEVWSCLTYLYRVWKRAETKGEFWRVFWGKPSPLAHRIGSEMARREGSG